VEEFSKDFCFFTENVREMSWRTLFSLLTDFVKTLRVERTLVIVMLFAFGGASAPCLVYGAKPLADYAVSVSVNDAVTDALSIVYTVSNLSDVAAPITSVKFFASSANGPAKRKSLGEVSTLALEPRQSTQDTVSFPLSLLSSFKTSRFQLFAQVNPKKKPKEVKFTNNTAEVLFEVQKETPSAPTPPDLKVSIMSAPDSVQTGAILSIEDVVQNVGLGRMGRFAVSYRLVSPSQSLLLGSRMITELPAGSTTTGSLQVSLPSTVGPGSYLLSIQATTTDSMRDANPSDNLVEKSISIITPPAAPPAPAPPGQTFLQDHDVHQAPERPRPELHVPFVDPTFGATIVRLTDPSMSASDPGHATLGLRHQYSRQPALNADNTKMAVRVLGGVYRGFFEVRDVATGVLLRRIAPDGDPEISWHPTDPNRFFYRSGNEVRIFAVDSGHSETVMRFDQYVYISTSEEGRPSDDWRYYAFIGYRDRSFATADLVVADLVEKRIVATWSDSGIPDWVSMSPSGEYVVAMWVSDAGTRVYARDTLALLNVAFSDYGHADFAFDVEGKEVIVYHATSGKQLQELGNPSGAPFAMARLADGKKTVLQSVGWDMTPHFCGLASREHPGWVLVSTYTDAAAPQRPFSREIFWLKLDGSGEVRRIGHHHSDQGFHSTPWGDEKDYFAEPQATSSWDGKLVVFASVWGEPFNHYDLYLLSGQWW
jgi:hypothetical protein